MFSFLRRSPLTLILLLTTVLLGTAMASRPLVSFEWYAITGLKLYGSESVKFGDLHARHRNYCDPEDKKSCQCVLLLHGLGDSSLTWRHLMQMSPSVWSGNKPYLVGLDLRGFGRTPLQESRMLSIREQAREIVNHVLPTCKRWHLVGNSWGGWIATHMALQSPEKLKSLTLIGAAGLQGDYSRLTSRFLGEKADDAKTMYDWSYHKTKFVPDYIFQRIVDNWAGMPLEELFRANMGEFIDDQLSKIKVPTQLVWGEADEVIPLEYAYRFNELIPNSELTILSKCGHLPQQECPDKIAQAINGVL